MSRLRRLLIGKVRLLLEARLREEALIGRLRRKPRRVRLRLEVRLSGLLLEARLRPCKLILSLRVSLICRQAHLSQFRRAPVNGVLIGKPRLLRKARLRLSGLIERRRIGQARLLRKAGLLLSKLVLRLSVRLINT